MRAMKAAERTHVEAIGESKFASALAKASMVIRMDSRLTGLDKIREPLALQAALEATGFEKKPFTLGKTEIPADTYEICNELLNKAKAAVND